MPKRTDIKSILLIGSGPIVIGQACEFDYSGTQAIKALREEGYRVILVNSNPATIMTDPELADRTYVEPITPEFVEKVIEIERPDAVLPTMGGQTALNTALALNEMGVFERYGCELIGASVDSIQMAEDRELFREAMDQIGLRSARSAMVRSIDDAEAAAAEIGYPMILRPSRTLGGSGGAIVTDPAELKQKISFALQCSPNREVLVEESLLGWKEIELEVMRDHNDNVVVICGIENFDPMGVHTGDSITVAPVQTLTDKEYQVLRDAAQKIIRKIGVDTGGSNVQFAISPKNGEVVIIEMNPRVSRSSALASKATGFPIAKIAAKLAVGYTLDEISNDITRETPACFEPAIDYVVVKIPRFAFEKFPGADSRLGPQMKSVGEVMSFGRSFSEALQKAICSMEKDSYGFDLAADHLSKGELLDRCGVGSPDRLWFVAEALRHNCSVDEVYTASSIDRWFLYQMEETVQFEQTIKGLQFEQIGQDKLLQAKRLGLSDRRISQLLEVTEEQIRDLRGSYSIRPVYRSVDTCAGEFKAETPYFYSSYESGSSEEQPGSKKKIMILGSGPNRIGQGIEFDYCCVHAVMALRENGFETIMVNCNPETVSTDYDVSDRLYFEPLTLEGVVEIVERERPDGVIVQFGGQTPLKLAEDLERLGIPIIGTSVDSIDIAEDRMRFSALIEKLGLLQPESATARSLDEALAIGDRLGYPLMIRPSFVLGGRAMRTVYQREDLITYMQESVDVSNSRSVLLDRFLHNAIEIDLDAVSDGKDVVVAGVMQHIERAGIHSGDSSCALPPQSVSDQLVSEMKRQAKILALELKVIGLMNIQFAITRNQEIYILEVNPRASRTIPFVSKATGVPWAKVASLVMAGEKLASLGITEVTLSGFTAVKACVFPFKKFSGVDTLLGPEMKSTGEVMGIDSTFAGGFAKAQESTGTHLPESGSVFLSVADGDKEDLVSVAKVLLGEGFALIATAGTAAYLKERGFEVSQVNKVMEGSPHVVDLLGQGDIQMVINTPEAQGTFLDSRSIRLVANELGVPTFTTMAAATAAADAIKLLRTKTGGLSVNALQDYHNPVYLQRAAG